MLWQLKKHCPRASRMRRNSGNWRSFISTVRPTVHSNPSQKRSFSQMLFQIGGIWKHRLFIFVWTETMLRTELSTERWRDDNHVIFLTEFSPNTNPKCFVIVTFLNSFGVAWMENIWCVFRVKPLFSNSFGVVCGGPASRLWLMVTGVPAHQHNTFRLLP